MNLSKKDLNLLRETLARLIDSDKPTSLEKIQLQERLDKVDNKILTISDKQYKVKKQKLYDDNTQIHLNLPRAYNLPPKTKKGQICVNCKFYENNYCTRWDAPIRPQYWCKSWKEIKK